MGREESGRLVNSLSMLAKGLVRSFMNHNVKGNVQMAFE